MKTKITAHSGCSNTTPGSIESVIKGFEIGADIVEVDVRMLGDVPVLSHDKVQSNEQYVKLSEAFDVLHSFDGKMMNLDIKETLDLSIIEQLAKEKGVFDQIFLTGINEKFMSFAMNSSIPYYLNFGSKSIFAGNSLYIKHLVHKTKKYGAVGINLNKCNCNQKLVTMFHDSGLFVSVWTIHNIDADSRYIKMIPDNITCTNPHEIIPLIGSLKN